MPVLEMCVVLPNMVQDAASKTITHRQWRHNRDLRHRWFAMQCKDATCIHLLQHPRWMPCAFTASRMPACILFASANLQGTAVAAPGLLVHSGGMAVCS